ncbi:outer membrane beta-barrel protein [Vibrio rumoiensis]
MDLNKWLGILLLAVPPLANAEVMITPMLGYTVGGSVKDNNGNKYDMQASESYAIAIETPVEKGRIGLFYSQQNTQLETLGFGSPIKYLHIQSSLDLPINERFITYVGIGLGGSYVDVSWAENKYGFSASGFAGLEYKITNHISINGQLRWLGTVVDSNSSTQCYYTQDTQNCRIQFDSDWMNQFQSNIGMTFRF